ncbi:zinc-binding alcohol dehydrogenase family protein [Maritimibacter sp. DP1N21-5]|uniref:zinc-binding alcohol dehydrogenase family protein n=1 Tax=Maritimibacter sp. DP1N21-5 TaxID=2836867 RepID=UPI001C4919D3|nr:zinc-binding alcohol dehydrogenase family protein [Maritimibacter sp. DP1N21-5]MBV7408547.1 zinc-binding alcohol dehydrogenase family protein [Maritimibacter sp. DP1N21-5]
MKAVGYLTSRPATDPQSLFDFEAQTPRAEGRDLLIRVEAISVNPLDAVQRMRRERAEGPPIILGWDAAGTVVARGPDAHLFDVGAAVMLSGDMRRDGANAEFVLADERVVARKPYTLGFTEAAALPLTAITAYEALFDRLKIACADGEGSGQGGRTEQETILLIGAAGGVGSMAVQLLRAKTGLRIIATASRPQSRNWLMDLGVDAVLDHTKPLAPQMAQIGVSDVRYAFPLNGTVEHWPDIVECLAPEGEVVVVDNPQGIDAAALRLKAGALHFEMMWTKVFQGGDRQSAIGALLGEVADLVDAGKLRSAASQDFGSITAANLRRAHQAVETGKTIGKITLTGFGT